MGFLGVVSLVLFLLLKFLAENAIIFSFPEAVFASSVSADPTHTVPRRELCVQCAVYSPMMAPVAPVHALPMMIERSGAPLLTPHP